VVDLARLAGLDHQARAQARARAHEVVVHRRDRQQRRDRDPLGADVAVREDDDVGAPVDRVGRLGADSVDRLRHPARALVDRPGDVDGLGLEDLV
jgi:hypothetical protein